MRKFSAFLLCTVLVLAELAVWQLQVQAQQKIDERAQALLQQARAAIGGEQVINSVKNLVMNGKVSHSLKTPDQVNQTIEGKFEMALELPNKFNRRIYMGGEENHGLSDDPAKARKKIIVKHADVLVGNPAGGGDSENVRIIGKADHEASAEPFIRGLENPGSQLSRMLFGLLLSSSPLVEYAYNYLGEGDVDGTAANIIEANNNGHAVKLYLDKQSHLPLMISFRGVKPHRVFLAKKPSQEALKGQQVEEDVVVLQGSPELRGVEGGDGKTKIFIRKHGSNENMAMGENGMVKLPRIKHEEAEIQIRFSDFRSVGNLLLPHRLTESINGEISEVMNVEAYEVNSPNISEKFKDDVLVFRKTKQK